jgi:hypothetical protein
MSTKIYHSYIARFFLILILISAMLGSQPARPVWASALVVTNTDDSGAGSLRQAIAGATSGDTITFDSALAGQTITLSSMLMIDKDLTIDGSTLSSSLSLSGNNSTRIFSISLYVTLELDSLILMNGNATTLPGGGGAIHTNGSLTVIDSTFIGNVSGGGGAIICNAGISNLILINSTFSSNQASTSDGGAVFTNCGTTIVNSTFSGNSAANMGGAIHINSDMQPSGIINSTFYGNSAVNSAGGISNFGTLAIFHSTFSHNGSANGGAIRDGLGGVLSLHNSILANSVGTVDCIKSDSVPELENSYNLIETTGSTLESCGVALLTSDPALGALQDNGGLTETMALEVGSPAIDAGRDTDCPLYDQRGVARPQDIHCDLGAYEAEGPIKVSIGGMVLNSYSMDAQESKRVVYAGINNGPVKILATDSTPLIFAERVIYKVGGVNASFTEMMGLPENQVDNTYWLPWYNNVDLDTQLRFANVSGSPATVTITIGGLPMGDPIQLAARASTRVSFAGVNNGPVKIMSTQNIVAAERLIYKANGKNTSFSEMMALPASQLDTTYWLPWYNNVDLDTQLRFANVSGSTAQVHVYIGGVEMPNSPFSLLPGESTRQSFAGVNNGPVKIVSNVPIVAAERLIYKVAGVNTSFSEMRALPNSKLDTTYWLPWYNNADLDTQLRFANVHASQTAQVHVYIGGVEMPNSPFSLLPGASTRQSFAGINSGPVQIASNVPIVAAERLIYKVNGVNTSFSEMMALPNSALDTTYWLPWYNNVDLDTQLRFGVP